MRPLIVSCTSPLMIALILGAACVQTDAQTVCTLSVDQAPAIRGIRLGMTSEQVFRLIPGSREKSENKRAMADPSGYPGYGVARVSIQRAALPESGEQLAGIDWISLTFFDDRIVTITVSYAGPGSNPRGPSWPNVDAFIAKLSSAFALPDAKEWFELDQSKKPLKCKGFELEASVLGTGHISLRDNTVAYQDIVRRRAADDEEKRRREFKP